MDEDDPMGQFEAGEEKSIVMRVPKPLPPPSGEYLGRPVFPLFAWLPRTLYSLTAQKKWHEVVVHFYNVVNATLM